MATLLTYPIFRQANGGANGQNFSLTAAGGAVPVTIGQNNIVRIAVRGTSGTGSLFVRFGPSGTSTATSSDIVITKDGTEYFDMGSSNSVIVLATDSTTALLVSVAIVSRT